MKFEWMKKEKKPTKKFVSVVEWSVGKCKCKESLAKRMTLKTFPIDDDDDRCKHNTQMFVYERSKQFSQRSDQL